MGQQLVGNLSLIVNGVAVKLGYHTKKVYQVGFHFFKFINNDDLFLSNPSFMKLILLSLYITTKRHLRWFQNEKIRNSVFLAV